VLPVARISLPGLIVVIIAFFGLVTLIAAHIQIDGSAVNMPGGTSTSLLSHMWDGFINTVGAGLNHIFNPFSWE
jgi:hypothetical protein